jgi:hypothetical protein
VEALRMEAARRYCGAWRPPGQVSARSPNLENVAFSIHGE